MFVTFLVMAGIEITLLVDKPYARDFVITVLLSVGLILRGQLGTRAPNEKRNGTRVRGSSGTADRQCFQAKA